MTTLFNAGGEVKSKVVGCQARFRSKMFVLLQARATILTAVFRAVCEAVATWATTAKWEAATTNHFEETARLTEKSIKLKSRTDNTTTKLST